MIHYFVRFRISHRELDNHVNYILVLHAFLYIFVVVFKVLLYDKRLLSFRTLSERFVRTSDIFASFCISVFPEIFHYSIHEFREAGLVARVATSSSTSVWHFDSVNLFLFLIFYFPTKFLAFLSQLSQATPSTWADNDPTYEALFCY